MTTTTAAALSGSIPQPIVRTLRRLVRRRRMVIVVRGLCAVLAVAVGAILGVMAVDAGVTLFAAWPRWLLTISALSLTLAALVLLLIRPLVKSFSLAAIARTIESRHPELHERISSAVELLSSTDGEALRGSSFLIEALAQEACRDALAVAPRREVTLRSVRPYFIAATAVVGALAALLALWPRPTGFLLARALAPYKNLANIQASDMTITPGDATIAAGQRLRVQVRVASDDVRKAYFRRARDGAPDIVEEMTPLAAAGSHAGREFALTLPAAEAAFSYRVNAGDAVSRYYDVQVVALPSAKGIDVIYNYPAYAMRAPEVLKRIDGDIKALAGTEVTILLQVDAPLSAGQMLINGQPLAAGQISRSNGSSLCTFKTLLPPRLDGRWSARLVRSANGLDFESFTPDRRIESLADLAPTIKVADPTLTALKLKPDERLPISFVATDDIGLASLEMLTMIDGVEQPPVAIELKGDQPRRLAVDNSVLDLAKMKLAGAASVTFQLRVRDTLPEDSPGRKGPQEALSELYTITLDANSQPYAVQVTIAQEAVIRQLLQELQKELQAAKQDSAPLAKTIEKACNQYADAVKAAADKGQAASDVPAPVFTDASGVQADRICARMDNSRKLVIQLAEKVAGSEFATMSEKVAQVDGHVRAGSGFASQIKVVEDAIQRKDKSERIDFHVYQALRIVTDLLEQLHVISELTIKAQQLEAMADRQRDLAEAKAAMEAAQDAAQQAATGQPASSPAQADAGDASRQPMTPDQWKRQENKLAAALGQMARKSPAAVAAQANRDAEELKDLSGMARQQAKEQAALAKESQRMAELAAAQREVKKLAAEQAALAKEAKADKTLQDESAKMSQAAKDLAAAELDKAVPQQKDAQKGLDPKAATQKAASDAAAEAVRSAADQAATRAAVAKIAAEQAAAEAQSKSADEKAAADSAAKAASAKAAADKAAADAAAAAASQPDNVASPEAGADSAEKAKAVAAAKSAAVAAAKSAQKAKSDAGAAAKAAEQAKSAADAAAKASEDAKSIAEVAAKAADEAKAATTQPDKNPVVSLAKRQAALTQRTAELSEKMKALQDRPEEELAALKVKQERLAKEAGDLSDKTKALAPRGDETDAKAAMAAKNASEHLNDDKVAEAAESAKDAAGKLERLARDVEKDAGKEALGSQVDAADSAREKAKLADRAADLAERQKDVAEQMQALAGKSPTDLAAARQMELSDKSARLEKDIKLIQQHSDELIEDAATRQEASAAAAEMTKATGSQKTAKAQLSAKNAGAAQAQQEQAAGALERTAAALDRLGKKLAEAADKKPSADGQPIAEEPAMDDAYDDTRKAAASEELSDAAMAAKMLGELAKQAAANAQAKGADAAAAAGNPRMKPANMPAWASDPKFGVGLMKTDLSPAQLEKLGINLKDWARLPGHLKDEVLQAAEENVPEEYRMLVKHYFQEIARRGGATDRK